MNFFRVALIIFFMPVASCCLSQDLRNFDLTSITEEDGLPSNEVYHAVEDHEGFIWFATDNGLCRYNGSEFKIFDSRHGLPTKSVFHLFPQPDSSIIGVCSDARFFEIKDNKISLIFDDEKYKKHINPLHFPFAYYVDSKGNHHIGTRFGYFLFDSNTDLITLDTTTVEYRKINFWLNTENDPFCYFKRNKRRSQNLGIEYENNQIATIKDDYSTYRSIYPSNNDKFTFLHSESKLILVDNETKNVVSIDYDGYCLGGKIDENNLYVFTYRDGVLIYNISKGQFDYQYTLESNLSVSSLLKTKNGIIYFTTLENGVKRIDTQAPLSVYSSNQNNNITAITSRNHNLIVGYESGAIHLKNDNKWFNTGRKVFELKAIKDQLLVSANRNYIINLQVNALEVYDPTMIDSIASNWISSLNDSLVVLSGKWLFRLRNFENHKIVFEESYKNEQFICGEVIGETVFLSYFSGMRIFEPLTKEKSRYIPTQNEVISFFRHNGNDFAVSDNMTILKIEGENTSTIPIPTPESVNSVFSGAYKSGILHISTNKGVFSWQLNQNGTPTKLINFDPIPLVRNLHLADDTLLYATNKQIYKKALSDLKIDLPNLFISAIKVGDSTFSGKHIELSYASNTIEINLDNVSLAEPFMHYRYRLEGNQEEYYYTSEGKIAYSSLPPGEYTFRVSGTSDGFNYSKEKSISLIIYPPFWKTWWFIFASIVIIALLTLTIIRYRIKQIRKKIELEETISRLRSQALIAQLNPHLVFNILNAIQGMVSKGQIEESNKYIARFSKFLRNSLNMSKKSTCSIEDEVHIIKQYLDLERLRFRSSIEFKVDVQIKNMEYEVPPLITQPLIENAIKHGVIPSGVAIKKIKLKIYQKENDLIIEVEDNGKGFKKDFSYGDGLRITKERIKGLSELNDMTIESQNGSTIVQLKIVKHD